MAKITLTEKTCKCGARISVRGIDIKSFRPGMFKITETTLQIWSGRPNKCWKCKKSPEIGEIWGLSLNGKERNRLFCPDCSKFIIEKLKAHPKVCIST